MREKIISMRKNKILWKENRERFFFFSLLFYERNLLTINQSNYVTMELTIFYIK